MWPVRTCVAHDDGNLDGNPDNHQRTLADSGSGTCAKIPTRAIISNQWQPDSPELKIRCLRRELVLPYLLL
jgi:hypothetical protein